MPKTPAVDLVEEMKRAAERRDHPIAVGEEPCPFHGYPDEYECPTCIQRGEEAWEARA